MSKDAFATLTAAVTTINTPMPAGIDEGTLLACLKGEISERKWRVHVQALFDEVDMSVIHNLVLDHIVTFGELLKAIDAWQVTESENERWVREMASFEVGRSPAEGAGRALEAGAGCHENCPDGHQHNTWPIRSQTEESQAAPWRLKRVANLPGGIPTAQRSPPNGGACHVQEPAKDE